MTPRWDAPSLSAEQAFSQCERVYGMNVVRIGEDGGILIQGHPTDWRRPLAAWLAWYRNEHGDDWGTTWTPSGTGRRDTTYLPTFRYEWMGFDLHQEDCDYVNAAAWWDDMDPEEQAEYDGGKDAYMAAREGDCACEEYAWWGTGVKPGTGEPVVSVYP